MTATLSTVPATETGIACAKCSHWDGGRKVTVRHASVPAVRLCQTGAGVDRAQQAIDDARAHLAARPELTGADVVRMSSLPPVPVSVSTMETLRALQKDAIARNVAAQEADMTPADPHSPSVDPEKIVPAGRYAIDAGNGTVKFYVVDRPETGPWAGYTFVSVQASDDLHRIRNRAERIRILSVISLDPAAASRRYGRELGRCGVCNRTLTDPDSIAAGIGPVCAGRF